MLKAYPEIATRKDGTRVSGETVAIISLLHDVCKIENYVVSMRNVKEDGKWIQKPYYEFKEKLSVGGHGAKSVYLIAKYMKLTDEEAAAIMCHMGAYEFSEKYGNIGNTYNQFLLLGYFMLQMSPQHISERKRNNHMINLEDKSIYEIHFELVRCLANATKCGNLKWSLFESVISPFGDVRDLYVSSKSHDSLNFNLYYKADDSSCILVINHLYVIYDVRGCVSKLHRIVEKNSSSDSYVNGILYSVIRELGEITEKF